MYSKLEMSTQHFTKHENLEIFLFCVIIDVNNTTSWVQIYLEYPRLQICPAALDFILERNPHLLQ